MGRRLIAAGIVALSACAGCGGDGSGTIHLVLSLPPMGDLRPTNLATVAIGITQEDGIENVTTTPLDGMKFTAGDVPLDEPIQLRVELRDNTNRLVAFGLVEQTITPDRSEQRIVIPVRKPIVYVSSEKSVVTLDPTLDGFDPKFQSMIGGTTGALAFPIDGNDIGVVTGASLQRLATADHKPTGSAVSLAVTGASDAARVPGERRMVFATGGGLVVADIETGAAMTIATAPKPDRVAVARNSAGGAVAYTLVGRVAPPTGTGTCMGSSMVLAYSLDTINEQPTMVATGQFSDIEASGDAVFAADPCMGRVRRIDAGGSFMMNVGGVGALAIEGQRLWAAGSAPTLGGVGARVRISSVRLDAADAQEVLLAPKAEVMIYDLDQKKELSLNIQADTIVPLDLTVLPGAQYVAVLTQMNSHRLARFDAFGKVIPEMDAVVHDIVLADPQSGAITQRIRAKCVLTLIANSDALFRDWSCITTTGAETPVAGESTPTTVGALYGGR